VATPGVRDVELVNGGYGIKHPLIRHSDVTTKNLLLNAQQLGQADTIIHRNYKFSAQITWHEYLCIRKRKLLYVTMHCQLRPPELMPL